MKLYRIQVTGPHPARYRGIAGETDAQAIVKAQARHVAAGFALAGHGFKITDSLLIVCNTVTEAPADARHDLHLADTHLGEIEMALVARVELLENHIALATMVGSLDTSLFYQAQLKKTNAALNLVIAA